LVALAVFFPLTAEGSGLRRGWHERLNLGNQNGQLRLHDLPDDAQVQARILVDDPVPQAREACPGDLRVHGFEVRRDSAGCFAEGLKLQAYLFTVSGAYFPREILIVPFWTRWEAALVFGV